MAETWMKIFHSDDSATAFSLHAQCYHTTLETQFYEHLNQKNLSNFLHMRKLLTHEGLSDKEKFPKLVNVCEVKITV